MSWMDRSNRDYGRGTYLQVLTAHLPDGHQLQSNRANFFTPAALQTIPLLIAAFMMAQRFDEIIALDGATGKHIGQLARIDAHAAGRTGMQGKVGISG